jgi:hypothetical protein
MSSDDLGLQLRYLVVAHLICKNVNVVFAFLIPIDLRGDQGAF